VGLDICKSTDLSSLEPLSLRAVRGESRAPTSATGSACSFSLQSSSNNLTGDLLVEASSLPSAEEAKALYRATSDTTVLKREGEVEGLGSRAEGLSRHRKLESELSEYLLHAQDENLVIKVWLATSGGETVSAQRLRAAVEPIVSATLAAVPVA
jgi:hypothetical protein